MGEPAGSAAASREPGRLARDIGLRYWPASLLPALLGTTLPFWIRPPGFSFRGPAAVEFLAGALLIHAGFSLLHARLKDRPTGCRPAFWPLGAAALFITTGCLVGLHLNGGLSLHRGVPAGIFIVYGLAALLAGALYVAPPFSFWRRVGGEVVLLEGLGLLPALGAYLVQVGDITRNVYLGSLPVVVATGLWVWMDELATRPQDEIAKRSTMVLLFSPRIASRLIPLMMCVALYATVIAAVLTASLPPWALASLATVPLAWRVLAPAWTQHDRPGRTTEARRRAARLHLLTGTIIAVSSLAPTDLGPRPRHTSSSRRCTPPCPGIRSGSAPGVAAASSPPW